MDNVSQAKIKTKSKKHRHTHSRLTSLYMTYRTDTNCLRLTLYIMLVRNIKKYCQQAVSVLPVSPQWTSGRGVTDRDPSTYCTYHLHKHLNVTLSKNKFRFQDSRLSLSFQPNETKQIDAENHTIKTIKPWMKNLAILNIFFIRK